MKKFFKPNVRTVLAAAAATLVVVLVIHTIMLSSVLSIDNGEIPATLSSNVNPSFVCDTTEAFSETAASASSGNKKETRQAVSAVPTEEVSDELTIPPTTVAQVVPFATAVQPASPASYTEQWNAGYLVAIDNPDKTYKCSQVNLTEEDRDLLERLCMGEFGSGGFIGASLIAQAVKNAMCFDGYPTVASVIKNCRYDGRTDVGTNDACRQAVRYIFDENGDAVQHRIMYMYNPYLVSSSFHESQNYILSYLNVRFFDRWGY